VSEKFLGHGQRIQAEGSAQHRVIYVERWGGEEKERERERKREERRQDVDHD
jgi:hypothetical protein